MKVKTFIKYEIDTIDNDINKWLSSRKIEIIQVIQTPIANELGIKERRMVPGIVISIFYEETE